LRDGGNSGRDREFNPVTTVSAVFDPKLIGGAEREMPDLGEKILRRRDIRFARIHIL